MKRTAETCRFIFGQEMNPCPQCGSYHLGFSLPIVTEAVPENASAKQMLGIWARAYKQGDPQVKGTCRIMCRACGHLGPAHPVSGEVTAVSRDPEVAKTVKDLWNNQPKSPPPNPVNPP